MPDDERESDDLFEDLDKFFAPIKDVDWDEPEAPPAGSGSPDPGATEEEHVTVRSEPEPAASTPPADEGRPRRSSRTTRATTATGTTRPRSSPSARRSEVPSPRARTRTTSRCGLPR